MYSVGMSNDNIKIFWCLTSCVLQLSDNQSAQVKLQVGGCSKKRTLIKPKICTADVFTQQHSSNPPHRTAVNTNSLRGILTSVSAVISALTASPQPSFLAGGSSHTNTFICVFCPFLSVFLAALVTSC